MNGTALRSLILASLAFASTAHTQEGKAVEASGKTKQPPAEAPAPVSEAQESAPASKKTSAELRITIISPSGRWGKVDARTDRITTHSERSLYYGPGLGARIYIRQPNHGLLVDFDYRLDTDIDSINTDSPWKTDFVVGRVGYAFRFFRHANPKMTWSFTPHASFSFGGIIDRNEGALGDFVSARGTVIGGMIGMNVDLHIERFFFGWAVEYEGLKHLSGTPLISSHFIRWTLVPIFRIGVDLGPPIQSLDGKVR